MPLIRREQVEVLRIACEPNASISDLEDLIDAGVFNVNALVNSKYHVTVLNRAIQKNSRPVIELLLSRGADANHRVPPGPCPLERALTCSRGPNPEVVRLLIAHGAKLYQPTATGDSTILDLALKELIAIYGDTHRLFEMVRVLVSYQDPVEQPETSDEESKFWLYFELIRAVFEDDIFGVQVCLASKPKLGINGARRATAAVLAAKLNHVEATRQFIARGIARSRIFWEACFMGNVEIVDLWSSMGHDPIAMRVAEGEQSGFTALHVACESAHATLARILIDKYGFQPEDRAANGVSAFHLTYENAELIKTLVSSGTDGFVDVNLKNAWGETPLHVITQQGDLYGANECYADEAYEALLRCGADPGIQDDVGRRATHECMMSSCRVHLHYLKLYVLDPKYEEGRHFTNIPVLLMDEEVQLSETIFRLELEELAKAVISRAMIRRPCTTLADVLYFDPARAARFSRNENLLRLYEESGKNFETKYRNYGFALNHQLRRGIRRRAFMELVRDLLHVALGIQIPADLGDEVFRNLSDKELERLGSHGIVDE